MMGWGSSRCPDLFVAPVADDTVLVTDVRVAFSEPFRLRGLRTCPDHRWTAPHSSSIPA